MHPMDDQSASQFEFVIRVMRDVHPLRNPKPVGIQDMRVRVRSDVLLDLGIRLCMERLPFGVALQVVQLITGDCNRGLAYGLVRVVMK